MPTKNPTFVTRAEAQLLKAMIWLANVKIRSTTQVEERCAREMVMAGYIATEDDFKTIKPHEVDRFREDQEELRAWLVKIAEPKEGDRAALVGEVNDFLKRKVPVAVRGDDGQRRFGPVINGLEAIYGYGVALLLDDERGLGTRLARCKAPNCGRFFLDLHPKGRPQQFCSDDHRMHYHAAKRKEERAKRMNK